MSPARRPRCGVPYHGRFALPELVLGPTVQALVSPELVLGPTVQALVLSELILIPTVQALVLPELILIPTVQALVLSESILILTMQKPSSLARARGMTYAYGYIYILALYQTTRAYARTREANATLYAIANLRFARSKVK
ncbi:MAG: hypothetical protein IJQ34_00400 [Kiritimatiellae bacterium]|nr:hypothetical protein [Kiritimatiellia bacterium]